MLDLVHCKVLSVIESEHVDAYLLSESSMFVFPHKLVLKTCGITTLLCGIPKLLEIAAIFAGFPHTPAVPDKGISASAAPHRVFYSRKNYLYPEQQRGPHRSWRDEVRNLDRLFRKGSAYMIGKMNGEHWYLYITEPENQMTPPLTPDNERHTAEETTTRVLEVSEQMASLVVNGVTSGAAEGDNADETLEVLMTDLEEDNAKQFYLEPASARAEGRFYQNLKKARKDTTDALDILDGGNIDGKDRSQVGPTFGPQDGHYDVFGHTSDLADTHSDADDSFPVELTTEGHALGTVVSDTCGLSDIYPISKYPEARIDAYLFTPCGFSANGVIPAQQPPQGSARSSCGHYFTVHVTPEPQCSYASFETNVPAFQSGRETVEVVEQVVNIFKPGRFSVTLFETKSSANASDAESRLIQKKNSRMDTIKGYRRADRIVHDLDGYDLVFRHYERYDWAGGAPRLGENY